MVDLLENKNQKEMNKIEYKVILIMNNYYY